ncbi:DUF3237 domain-containing protein [Pseudooceanicola onchidii]|uniref:DUF3237 domain-containing protein n=1 Tax=Pseudooceanicola onchidii TaxID=2562279 RepID=UPI0010AB2E6B|nr:DUF3237 domain-containing protein [Pseudooceanicola onchidii]
MSGIETRHLFKLDLEVGPGFDLCGADGTGRLIYHVTGGRFEGDRLRGRVLPVSGDWVSVHRGHARIDVRLMMETDEGAAIYMAYQGVNTLNASHRAQLAKGEPLDPASYYFRTTPYFEVKPGPYDWLTRVVAVGVGTRSAAGVSYEVFEVL